MVKYFLTLILVLLIPATVAFTRDNDTELKSEYSHDLTKVPFFLRYTFEKYHGKDWKESTYAERKIFLASYDKSVANELVQEKRDARMLASQDKQKQQAIRVVERAKRDKIKALIQEEKAEAREDHDRQKQFNGLIKAQERELSQLEHSIVH